MKTLLSNADITLTPYYEKKSLQAYTTKKIEEENRHIAREWNEI